MTQLNIQHRINYRGHQKGLNNFFFQTSFNAPHGILMIHTYPPNRYGQYYPQYGKGHSGYPNSATPMNTRTIRKRWRKMEARIAMI